MKQIHVLTVLLLALGAGACSGIDRRGEGAVVFDFEGAPLGSLPRGWRAESTRPEGPHASWQAVEDSGAPSGSRVLALVAPNHRSRGTFNLCWTEGVRFRDGELAVRFEAVAGEVDRGGGPIWRARDADNYYVCRANPLERNFRLYKVVAGERVELDSAVVDVASGVWHEIRVEHKGSRITCWLDGQRLLQAEDAALSEAGGVGVWTKADARTAFDDLALRPAPPRRP